MFSRAPLIILLAWSIAACGKQPPPPPGAAPASGGTSATVGQLYWLALLKPSILPGTALGPAGQPVRVIQYRLHVFELTEGAIDRLSRAARDSTSGDQGSVQPRELKILARSLSLHLDREARAYEPNFSTVESENFDALLAELKKLEGTRSVGRPAGAAPMGETVTIRVGRAVKYTIAAGRQGEHHAGLTLDLEAQLTSGGLAFRVVS